MSIIIIFVLCSLSCLVFNVKKIINKSMEDIIINTVGYYSLAFVTIFTASLVENSGCYIPSFVYIFAIFEMALFTIFGNAYTVGLWIDDNDIRYIR